MPNSQPLFVPDFIPYFEDAIHELLVETGPGLMQALQVTLPDVDALTLKGIMENEHAKWIAEDLVAEVSGPDKDRKVRDNLHLIFYELDKIESGQLNAPSSPVQSALRVIESQAIKWLQEKKKNTPAVPEEPPLYEEAFDKFVHHHRVFNRILARAVLHPTSRGKDRGDLPSVVLTDSPRMSQPLQGLEAAIER